MVCQKNSKLEKNLKCQVFFELLLLLLSRSRIESPPAPLPRNFARLALIKRGASDRKKGEDGVGENSGDLESQ